MLTAAMKKNFRGKSCLWNPQCVFVKKFTLFTKNKKRFIFDLPFLDIAQFYQESYPIENINKALSKDMMLLCFA